MRHLISLKEQTKEDILEMLRIAQQLKQQRNSGNRTPHLQDKTLIMLFQKTSTRTRLSFEAAMTELGGHAIYLDMRTSQFALAEFSDEIQAVMRFGDALMFRAKKVADVESAASFNHIPVIDACSEKYHPCQALSDLLTMVEVAGGLEHITKVVWMGIENNVSNTLMAVCAKLGIPIVICSPEADPISVDQELNAMAKATGLVTRTTNLAEALEGADFVHTDTWTNMEFFENGKVFPEYEKEYKKREEKHLPFQVNASIIEKYCPTAKIMHCMPLHVGKEISRDAIDHPNAIIFNQAENRLHMQKAILLWLLEKDI